MNTKRAAGNEASATRNEPNLEQPHATGRPHGGCQQEGRPPGPDPRSLEPVLLCALLKAVAENNRRLQEAEDERRAETYNALTCGLYGVIQGLKAMREDTKLIRQLDEEIRQEELAKKRAEEGEEKQP